MFSLRYGHTSVKKYDGIEKGTSSLWAFRMSKAYGTLPEKLEHELNPNVIKNFDYSEQQIKTAKLFRIGFYKRLLRPEDIFKVLCYCPVTLEMRIFSSIFNDQDGIVTMPDGDDKEEDVAHAVTVVGYKDDNFIIDNRYWPDWGNKGMGTVSLEYLKKYFITAFAFSGFVLPELQKRKTLFREEFKFNNVRYYFDAFAENNFQCDKRAHYNIEVTDDEKNLIGWAHLAVDKETTELLELFVLTEYRRQGIGSALIKYIIKHTNTEKFTGYVAGQDLISEREEIVKSFFLKNGFLLHTDSSSFKDCRSRIEKL